MRQVYPDCKRVTVEQIYEDLRFGTLAARPTVAVNMVSSVDGRTTAMALQKYTTIGSSVDRQLMGWLRQAVDAVVRGAGTVRANPAYPAVPPELELLRRERGGPGQPLAVVVSNSCDLPLDAPIFQTGPRRPVIVTSEAAPAHKVKMARENADVIVAGKENVDLTEALSLLQQQHDVNHVLLEGGPHLNYQFFRLGLVDELFWTVAPKLMGGSGELSLIESENLFDPFVQLQLVTAFTLDDELFLRYRVLT